MSGRSLIALALATLGVGAGAEDWPQWRGPRSDGTSRAATVPLAWGPDRGRCWSVDLPGEGHSSPVVSGGSVFVTTALGGGHERALLRLDAATGALLWSRTVARSTRPGEPPLREQPRLLDPGHRRPRRLHLQLRERPRAPRRGGLRGPGPLVRHPARLPVGARLPPQPPPPRRPARPELRPARRGRGPRRRRRDRPPALARAASERRLLERRALPGPRERTDAGRHRGQRRHPGDRSRATAAWCGRRPGPRATAWPASPPDPGSSS